MKSTLFRSDPQEQEAGSKDGRPEKNDAGTSRSVPDPSPSRRPQDVRPEGPSVIGPGTEIVGHVDMRGDLRVEGRIEGTVSVEGEVVISERGSVEGEIDADEVVLEGRVEGSVRARGSARFRSGCRMRGDVTSPVVEIEEGGLLDGRVDMTGERAAPAAKPGREAPAAKPSREAPDVVARDGGAATDEEGRENGA